MNMQHEAFENTDFYRDQLKKYLNTDAEVPPPWIFSPGSHPYSIQWRMGEGESYQMVFAVWFGKHFTSVAQRISFFKKYPPPPRWLGWMADAVWDLEPIAEDFDYTGYFEQLKSMGFGGTELYFKDLEDEQWE